MGMTVPFLMAQTFQDEDMPSGRQNYWKAGNLTELSSDAIDVIAEQAVTATSPYCTVTLLLLGGAVAAVGETDTAYCGRDALFELSIDNIWEDRAENESQIAWTRAFHEAMSPYYSAGVYLNWASEETRRSRASGVRSELRAARRAEGSVRPDELLLHEPEHQAVGSLTSAMNAFHGRAQRSVR